jgi:hypothetical protein
MKLSEKVSQPVTLSHTLDINKSLIVIVEELCKIPCSHVMSLLDISLFCAR